MAGTGADEGNLIFGAQLRQHRVEAVLQAITRGRARRAHQVAHERDHARGQVRLAMRRIGKNASSAA